MKLISGTMKAIGKIILMMVIVVTGMLASLLILKFFGISGGWLTRIIPFIWFIVVTTIFTLKIDKKSFKDIGLFPFLKSKKEFGLGILFATIPVIIGLLLTLLNISNIGLKESIGIGLIGIIAYYALVAFSEEILFRGYMLNAFPEQLNWMIKAIIASIFFTAFHAINSEFNSEIAVFLFIFGLLFAYMYLKSGNLWMPIGFHMTWNIGTDYLTLYSSGESFLGLLVVAILILLTDKKGFYKRSVTVDDSLLQ